MWYPHTHWAFFFFYKVIEHFKEMEFFEKIGVNIEKDLNDLSSEAKTTFPFAVYSYRIIPGSGLLTLVRSLYSSPGS